MFGVGGLAVVEGVEKRPCAERGLTLDDLAGMGARRDSIADLGQRSGEESVVAVVRSRKLAVGFDCVAVGVGAVLGAAKVAPEPFGMVGIETHGAPNPFDPLFG